MGVKNTMRTHELASLRSDRKTPARASDDSRKHEAVTIAGYGLIELQRRAGNQLVTSLLAGAGGPPVVQRAKTKSTTKTKTKKTGVSKAPKKTPYDRKQSRARTAILTGKKGRRPDFTVSGQLQSRGGTPLYGQSDFAPIGSLGYASAMHVAIADWNHTPHGTGPSVKPPWWPTGDSWWQKNMVQGHLLNENLGGPGNDMRNLAPISKRANSEHLHRVETLAKNTAIQSGQAIVYSVDVDAGPPPTGYFDPYESDTNEPNRGLIANLPKGFTCELQDEDGNTLVSWTVVNRL